MLLFNFSDQSVKIARLSTSLLGTSISLATEEPLKEGLVQKSEIADPKGLAEALKIILGKLKVKETEAALILHDERTYTLRLSLSKTHDHREVEDLLRQQVMVVIPEPWENLAFAYEPLNGEVQFLAAPKALLEAYRAVFKEIGVVPKLAVSESYALHTLLAPSLKEGETVIYLDPEVEASDNVVLDKQGVVETFSNNDPEKVKRFAKERWDREITRIIGSADLPAVLKSYPISLPFKASEAGRFARLLGLALLTRQSKPLNLLA